MSNRDDTNKVLVGTVIGIVGLGALSFALSKRHKNNDHIPVDLLEEALENFGKILKSYNIKAPLSAIKDVEHKLEKNHDNMNDVLEWIITGMELWKKIKH